MKCEKPNTDQELELTVLADGKPCAEYSLKTSSTCDGFVECYIPVTPGDQLTIIGSFSGSCCRGSFDVLLDGSFAACKRIEAPKSGDSKKHNNYKVRFEEGFDAPRGQKSSAFFTPEKIVESHMLVKCLDISADDADGTPEGTEFGSGTLTVLVALSQEKSDTHKHAYKSLTCGDLDLNRSSFKDGEIFPNCQLEVKVTDDEVKSTRQTRYKNNADQARPGHQPWCVMVLYYRTKENIEAANCVEKTGVHELEPADAGSFIYGSIETKRKKRSSKGRRQQTTPSVASEETKPLEQTDSLFVATPAPSSSGAATLLTAISDTEPRTPAFSKFDLMQSPPTPSAPLSSSDRKNILMGQKLDVPLDWSPTASTFPFRRRANQEDLSRAVNGTPTPVEEEFEERYRSFAEFKVRVDAERDSLLGRADGRVIEKGLVLAEQELAESAPVAQMSPLQTESATGEFGHSRARQAPTESRVKREEDEHISTSIFAPFAVGNNPYGSSTPASSVTVRTHLKLPRESGDISGDLATPSHSETTAMTSTMHTSQSSQPPSQHAASRVADTASRTSDVASQRSDKGSRSGTARSNSNSRSKSCSVTEDDIHPLIPAEGITLLQLVKMFSEEQVPRSEFAGYQFRRLVQQVADEREGRYYLKGTAPQSQKVTTENETASAALAAGKAKESEGQKEPKSEPQPSSAPEEKPLAVSAAENQAVAPLPSSSPAHPALKRSASTTIRDPIPSKRARFDEIAARKAALLQRAHETRKRKEAAQKDLLEQQQKREEEEQRRIEAEERELAMLEKQAAEDEVEAEKLENLKAEEEILWKEAMEGRVKVEKALRASEGA